MKNLILILAVSLSFQGFSQTFSRITKNGGESGYNYSKIDVDNEGNASFFYEGAGYEKAFIAFAPNKDMVYSEVFQEKAVNFALAQIEEGNRRGRTFILNENGKRFRLMWKADRNNANNTKIIMKPTRS